MARTTQKQKAPDRSPAPEWWLLFPECRLPVPYFTESDWLLWLRAIE